MFIYQLRNGYKKLATHKTQLRCPIILFILKKFPFT